MPPMTPMTIPVAVDLTEADLDVTILPTPEEPTNPPTANPEVTFNAQLTEVQEYKTKPDASFAPVTKKRNQLPPQPSHPN